MKRILLRSLAAAAVLLIAAGASPGAVGSCSDTSKAIDWTAFCQAKSWAMCRKWDELGGDMPTPVCIRQCTDPAGCNSDTDHTDMDRNTLINMTCASTPAPCNGPTDLAGEACVEAIYRRATLSREGDLPSECVLCGGS